MPFFHCRPAGHAYNRMSMRRSATIHRQPLRRRTLATIYHLLHTDGLPATARHVLRIHDVTVEVHRDTALAVDARRDAEERHSRDLVRPACRHEDEVVLCCDLLDDRPEGDFGLCVWSYRW